MGGSAILDDRNHGGLRVFINLGATSGGYRACGFGIQSISDSIFILARGAILVVKFFRGVKVDRKKIPKDFEENRTRV